MVGWHVCFWSISEIRRCRIRAAIGDERTSAAPNPGAPIYEQAPQARGHFDRVAPENGRIMLTLSFVDPDPQRTSGEDATASVEPFAACQHLFRGLLAIWGISNMRSQFVRPVGGA
jgi:hypothetical protein